MSKNPIIISGPSGSGKDFLAAKLKKQGYRIGSLDMLGHQTERDGERKWIIPTEYVKRAIASGQFDAFTGTSNNLNDWINLFDTLLLLNVDLPTAQNAMETKRLAMAERLRQSGSKEKITWWQKPATLEEYYGDWLKPKPHGFEGTVVWIDNSRPKDLGYAWHEWDDMDAAKKARDHIRSIVRYTNPSDAIVLKNDA